MTRSHPAGKPDAISVKLAALRRGVVVDAYECECCGLWRERPTGGTARQRREARRLAERQAEH